MSVIGNLIISVVFDGKKDRLFDVSNREIRTKCELLGAYI